MIVKDDPDELRSYVVDASNMSGGFAERVCIAESADEIAELLAQCSHDGSVVTVAGSGTGLVGGAVPMGGTVLSTRRLDRIVAIDRDALQATVEPGVLLGELQSEVERLDLLYPPDPTERNCSIGGTIATNASGARTFKYGATRRYVDALDVALATGERLELVRGEALARDSTLELTTVEGRTIALELPTYKMPAIKHAAGYYVAPDMDAIDLFVGSEGTLGVVTRAVLRLVPAPDRIVAGLVFFEREPDAIAFVEESRRRSLATRRGLPGVDARALEFLDGAALLFVRSRFPAIPENAMGGAIWFEQEVTDETEEGLLGEWYQLLVAHDALIDDSWFAVSLEDQRRMRELRHAVPSAVYEFIAEHHVAKIGTDMAVPDGSLGELLAYYRAELARTGLTNLIWGHVGNNHLHANVLADGPEQYRIGWELYGRLIDKALELGGTISAEHGVGKLKKKYLERMFGADGIAAMRRVKRALDPANILGRGTMFD